MLQYYVCKVVGFRNGFCITINSKSLTVDADDEQKNNENNATATVNIYSMCTSRRDGVAKVFLLRLY